MKKEEMDFKLFHQEAFGGVLLFNIGIGLEPISEIAATTANLLSSAVSIIAVYTFYRKIKKD